MRSPLRFLFAIGGALAASAEPCWEATDLKGDPLFFVQGSADGSAGATLLRIPQETPTIRSASGEIAYEAGRDFIWRQGTREIRLLAGSRISFKTTAELHPAPGAPHAYKASVDGRSWLLYSQGHFFHDLQCAAYYRAQDDWIPPRVEPALASHLSRVRAKLRAKEPVTMVVLGDSISTGLNASITSAVAPRQDGYVGLVAQGLERRFGSRIKVKNLSISGKSSPWGLEQVLAVIAESPDLFLCAFGMNDASSRRPAGAFRDTINEIVGRIRSASPQCDVIIVTPMTANPEWTGAAPELYPAYADAMNKLAGPGVAVADVTTIWRGVVARKGVLDLTGNGLNHPNDFGHRIYADVILETIER